MDLGLLQRDVAARIGVDESTVWNWESNATTPVYQHWEAIPKFLGYNRLPPAQTLAEQLVVCRKLKGLSQKQMARHLGVGPSTPAGWERGQRVPQGKYLRRVGVFLGSKA